MKLLIACDDATDVRGVVADLQRAGLEPGADVIVMTVADLLPLPPAGPEARPMPNAVRRARERVARALDEARRTSEAAVAQIRAAFRSWRVVAEACADAPAWAIVKKADEWLPDLIIVGSHDHSALGRVLLGSVSQAVLAHAECSVRLSRPPAADPTAPQRILVGVDGSAAAAAAVARVASRKWLRPCQVRLLTALDPTLASTLELGDDSEDEHTAAGRLVDGAAVPLRAAGLDVTTTVIEGSPKRVLVEHAKAWDADCVFLGVRGWRAAGRLLLGSVSAAVAARAHCSVEVVRP